MCSPNLSFRHAKDWIMEMDLGRRKISRGVSRSERGRTLSGWLNTGVTKATERFILVTLCVHSAVLSGSDATSGCMRRMERLAGHRAKNAHCIGSARSDEQRHPAVPPPPCRQRQGVPSSEANAVSTTLCGFRSGHCCLYSVALMP